MRTDQRRLNEPFHTRLKPDRPIPGAAARFELEQLEQRVLLSAGGVESAALAQANLAGSILDQVLTTPTASTPAEAAELQYTAFEATDWFSGVSSETLASTDEGSRDAGPATENQPPDPGQAGHPQLGQDAANPVRPEDDAPAGSSQTTIDSTETRSGSDATETSTVLPAGVMADAQAAEKPGGSPTVAGSAAQVPPDSKSPAPTISEQLVKTLRSANGPPEDVSNQTESFRDERSSHVGLLTVPGGRQTVAGTLSSDANWSGIIEVTGNFAVAGGVKLTVAPGTVIKMASGAYFQVNGVLEAKGTAAAPIIFTSAADDSAGGDTNGDGNQTQPGRGNWSSMLLWNVGQGTVLENVEVRYGGGGFEGALDLRGGGSSPSLTNLVVRESKGRGIYIESGAPKLNEVTVDGAGDSAYYQRFSGRGATYRNLHAGNTPGGAYVLLEGGSMGNGEQWTWDFGGLPVAFTSNISVTGGATLTLPAGTIVKSIGGYFYVDGGILKAQGTKDAPVILTSIADDTAGGDNNGDGDQTAPGRGQWQALLLWNVAAGTVLENVEVRYGGGGYEGAIDMRGIGSAPVLNNVLVKDTGKRGVYIESGAPTLTNVVVDGGNDAAFYQRFNGRRASYQNLSARNTPGGGYVLMEGGNIGNGEEWTWNFGGLAVVYTSNISITGGATVVLPAGTIIKSLGGFFYVDGGILKAQGTKGAPVIFTSKADDSAGGDTNGDGTNSKPAGGDWQALLLWNTGEGTQLDNVEVRYSGAGYEGAIELRGGSSNPTLNNVLVREAGRRGVYIESGAPKLNSVTVDGSTDAAFYQRFNGRRASYQNLNARNTPGGAYVLMEGGNVGGGEEWTWNFGGLPVVYTSNISITGGATVILPAGTIIKSLGGFFYVDGGILKAEGTSTAPVILTSVADDTVGGDNNGDGARSLPARGTGNRSCSGTRAKEPSSITWKCDMVGLATKERST
ncbi:MAG: LEPR-XLL domain-containing protein [Verrucomicrobiota bacterium]